MWKIRLHIKHNIIIINILSIFIHSPIIELKSDTTSWCQYTMYPFGIFNSNFVILITDEIGMFNH